MKLEINCPFIRAPITCTCNIELLWSIFPLNIVQFITDVVQKRGVFGKLIQCTMPILSNIPSCTIPSMCLSHCPSHYYPVAFLGRCAQVFQIYSNKKITDHILRRKHMTHLSPSLPVHITAGSSNCSDETLFSTTTWWLHTKASVRSRASVLRWRYCISRAYQLNYQAWWKWPRTA